MQPEGCNDAVTCDRIMVMFVLIWEMSGRLRWGNALIAMNSATPGLVIPHQPALRPRLGQMWRDSAQIGPDRGSGWYSWSQRGHFAPATGRLPGTVGLRMRWPYPGGSKLAIFRSKSVDKEGRIRTQWRHGGKQMTHTNNQGADRRSEVLRKLRREILTARLKVTLDEKRNRTTSPTVKFLSEMRLPSVADVQIAAGDLPRTGREVDRT